MNSKYAEMRRSFEEEFSRYSVTKGSEEEFISPSGAYQLQIMKYSSDKGPSRHYSRGIVTRQSDGVVIADVKRNYPHFWHSWVRRPSDNEYLLCGEDYQGYSVINLTRESYQIYFPDDGYEGLAFCWVAAYPSPDNHVLAVEGCYWGCPYEVVFYDFRSPDDLPYKELGREVLDPPDGIAECDAWIDNNTLQIQREILLRKTDGALYDDLPEAEQEDIDAGETEAEYTYIKVKTIVRPSLGEMA